MREHRRWLHQHAEISFQETETSRYIYEFYKKRNMPVKRQAHGNGMWVTIGGKNPGKHVALRADFDALPIQEETGLSFACTTGAMHACGHDAHTAYLMILAGCLWDTRERWNGTVRILHQPAEEMPPGGARAMIADGALQGIDYVLGCHVMNQLEFGGVFYHCGATQQARAKFTIQIQGKGGHGSSPHEANDAIVIAGHLVIALQTIVSRRISPMESGVVTIGSFDGKGEFNSIKDRVILEGDVRCMAESTRKKIEEEIKRIAFGTACTYGCDITVQYQNDYPVLWNDPSLTKRVVREWKKAGIAPVTDCGPLNPSEDFSYYSQQVPSCFFYIGAQPAGKAYPHHHPKFDIREEAMMKAARAMTVATLTCLAEKEMR